MTLFAYVMLAFLPLASSPEAEALVRNAFAIYLIHPILVHAANAAGLLPPGSCSAVVEWALAAGGSVIMAELMRRFLPGFSDWAFGGR